jgi:hypothetical protein
LQYSVFGLRIAQPPDFGGMIDRRNEALEIANSTFAISVTRLISRPLILIASGIAIQLNTKNRKAIVFGELDFRVCFS